jgi:hypothetical protein
LKYLLEALNAANDLSDAVVDLHMELSKIQPRADEDEDILRWLEDTFRAIQRFRKIAMTEMEGLI